MSPFVLETFRILVTAYVFSNRSKCKQGPTTKQIALHRQFMNSLQTIQENSLSYPVSGIKE